MKHPGPWSSEWLTCHPPRLVAVVDANMIPVICSHSERREMCVASEEAIRLILAAPELLASLEDAVQSDFNDWPGKGAARALIERIEKGG